MTATRKNLCIVYGVVALIALVGTWWNNILYFQDGGSLVDFFKQGYLNHATSSLTNDLILLLVSAFILMVVEARRLGIKYVWVYLVLSMVIAVSVMFPLFLIARERALGAREAASVTP